MNKLTDQQVIGKLRSPLTTEQEEAFVYLYGMLYEKSVAYIQKNSGTEEDARDIFQDALFVFYKMVRQDRVSTDTNPSAYVFSVFRNLWLKKLKKRKRETPLQEEIHDAPVAPEQLEELLQTEQHELLGAALQALKADCRAILIAYYYDQLRMEEIVKTLDFSSVQVAKNKKYKCMKKLRAIVLNSDYFRSIYEAF